MSIQRRAAMVAVAASAVSVMGATTAAAEPRTRLPNADLVCGDTTIAPTGWVSIPSSDTLWVTSGQYAGHYVIITDTHYLVPGYAEKPPSDFDGLGDGMTRTRGVKAGLAGMSITCVFVSRWGEPGDPDTFSVIGPVTMARVGR